MAILRAVDADDLLDLLGRLNRATVEGMRAPHKPLLLLWLLGRLAREGTSAATYEEAEGPVSRLIDDYGPPARSRRRAAMPFFHLERELWDLQADPGSSLTDQAGRLRAAHARGRLRPDVERLLLQTPGLTAAAARRLLDGNFTERLAELIAADVGLDVAALGAPAGAVKTPVRRRSATFAEDVLRSYAYACAVCGFDGALGRNPVALEAAHVRWHSQRGPDDLDNGLALCSLHHTLLDLGVLGISEEQSLRVSPLFVSRSDRGESMVRAFDQQPLRPPQSGSPPPSTDHIRWHALQVFKVGGHMRTA